MSKFIIFTVCSGSRLDNQRTEMVHRVLDKNGIKKRTVNINGKRCFIIPYSVENKKYTDMVTKRYGSNVELLKIDHTINLMWPNLPAPDYIQVPQPKSR